MDRADRNQIWGRERERAVLDALLSGPDAPGPRVVLFSGPPGIGKSRLLDYAGETAEGYLIEVLRGGGVDLAGAPAGFPIREALEPWIASHPNLSGYASLRRHLAILANWFEGDDRAAVSADEANANRFRLYEAVAAILNSAAVDSGAVLLLDDLQWADRTTLELILFLVRGIGRGRLRIVGALRDESEFSLFPSDGRLESLTRNSLVATFRLDALETNVIEAWAAHHLDRARNDVVVKWTAKASGGVPFDLDVILHSLKSSQTRLQEQGGVIPGTIEDFELPFSAVDHSHRKLAELTPEGQDLIRAGAVLGRMFPLALIAQATGVSRTEAERLASSAVSHRLIVQLTPDSYSFQQDLVRTSVLQRIDQGQLRVIHGRLAGAMIAELEGSEWWSVGVIAGHLRAAGETSEAVPWLMKAAEEARRSFDFEAARTLLLDAFAVVTTDDWETGRELNREIADLGLVTGHERDAIVRYTALVGDCKRSGDFAGVRQALYGIGTAWWRMEEIDPAIAAFEQVIARQGMQLEPVDIRVRIDLATIYGDNRHDHVRGLRLGEEALRMAESLDSPDLVAVAKRALGTLFARFGDLDQGIVMLSEALHAAEARDDPIEAAECAARLASAYYFAGALDRSWVANERRQIHAERLRDPFQLRHVYTWFAMLDALQGNSDQAVAWLDRSEPIVATLTSPEPRAWLNFCRAMVADIEGNSALAAPHFESAIAAYRVTGSDAVLPYLGPYVEHLQRRGDARADVVRREFARIVTELPPESSPPLEALGYLGSIAVRFDDRDLMARVYPEMSAKSGQFGDMLFDRVLAEIEIAQNRLSEARVHLDAAMEHAVRERMVWEERALLQNEVTWLVKRGAAANEIQQAKHRAEAFEVRLGIDIGESGSESTPGSLPGLTRREQEVLSLLASGMTNREIAAVLFLSEKTIERHLTNMYAKLGVANRAGAVAIALQSGSTDVFN